LRARQCSVHLYPFPLEQLPRGLEETGIVVDQQASQRHAVSMSSGARVRITANANSASGACDMFLGSVASGSGNRLDEDR
jgi:hypothetical protein